MAGQNKQKRVNEQSVLITGGTSGIGLTVAKAFIAEGATVTITGRRTNGEQIAGQIGANYVQCDTTDEPSVAALLKGLTKAAPLDTLIVNAGIADDEESIEGYSSERARSTIDINLFGTFLMLKYGPAALRDGGSIICTGSIAGSGITHAGAGVYAASKAGVAYLARTSAIELADRGVRVNVVCPAVIADTGMMVPDDGSTHAQIMSTVTAMGRMGRLDEVTGAYLFLASSDASFITGQELRVDGGTTAGIGNPTFGAIAQAAESEAH